MDILKIGSFLQTLRKAKGMTQDEVAEYFSISSKTVSKWECGNSLPEIPMLKALSEFYEVTVDEILNGERRETSQNLADKNRKDMSEYFIKKHYSRLNLWFLISVSILVLAFITIYALGYAGVRRDVTCWVSVVLSVISIFFNIFGLYHFGSMSKDLRLDIRRKYLIHRILYSFNQIMVFIFVLYSAIYFYMGINSPIMEVHFDIGYYSWTTFNNFSIFVFTDIVVHVFTIFLFNLFKETKPYVKGYHNYLYFIFLGFIFIEIFFGEIYSVHGTYSSYTIWSSNTNALPIILSGVVLYFVSVVLAIIFTLKKENNILSYIVLEITLIVIYIGSMSMLSPYSSGHAATLIAVSAIGLFLVIIIDIIHLIRKLFYKDRHYI